MLVKLMLNLDKIDLNVFFARLEQARIEVCLYDDVVCLHTKDNSQSSIRNIMKELNIQEFMIKELNEERQLYDLPDLLKHWCQERLNETALRTFEETKQEELLRMLQNIDNIRQLLLSQSNKNIKEEVVANGDRKA